MATQDKVFEIKMRDPAAETDLSVITLAATYKALYAAANFPVLDTNYWTRIGKRMRIRVMGRITTGATPGNLQIGLFYGDGTDANGVKIVESAVQTLIASQTNLQWEAEFDVHARSLGAAGTLFGRGKALFNSAVIAAQSFLIPGSAPVVSPACDFTLAKILSVQALRSGSTAETMQLHDIEYQILG